MAFFAKFKMATVRHFGIIMTSHEATHVDILRCYACVKISFEYIGLL